MKNLLFISLVLCMSAAAPAENTAESNKSGIVPTHILQLIQPESTEPINVEVKLYKKNNTTVIANLMPDGQLMETDYLITEDNKIKFQWASIKREGLVTIQFVGNKSNDGSFEGKFTALVDGVLRDDMSGRFILKKITPSS